MVAGKEWVSAQRVAGSKAEEGGGGAGGRCWGRIGNIVNRTVPNWGQRPRRATGRRVLWDEESRALPEAMRSCGHRSGENAPEGM